jgi:hypothetical protein
MYASAHLVVPEMRLAIAGSLGALAIALPAAGIAALVSEGPTSLSVVVGVLAIALASAAVAPMFRLCRAGTSTTVVGVHLLALSVRFAVAAALVVVCTTLLPLSPTAVAAGVAAGLVAALGTEMLTAVRDPRFFWLVAPPTRARGSERHPS